jgi:hypothetical protein
MDNTPKDSDAQDSLETELEQQARDATNEDMLEKGLVLPLMKTARNHIKDAIKLYRKNDATEFGSYRDVITDLLHLLRADKTAQKRMPIQSGKPDLFYALQEGWDVFNEECLHAEIAIIDKSRPEK